MTSSVSRLIEPMVMRPNTAANSSVSRKVGVRRTLGFSTQAVPGAAYGAQQGGIETGVYLLPQPADVHVDDVGLRIEVVAPDALQQHGARDHLAGVAQQVFQQLELARLQIDGLALAGDGAGDEI